MNDAEEKDKADDEFEKEKEAYREKCLIDLHQTAAQQHNQDGSNNCDQTSTLHDLARRLCAAETYNQSDFFFLSFYPSSAREIDDKIPGRLYQLAQETDDRKASMALLRTAARVAHQTMHDHHARRSSPSSSSDGHDQAIREFAKRLRAKDDERDENNQNDVDDKVVVEEESPEDLYQVALYIQYIDPQWSLTLLRRAANVGHKQAACAYAERLTGALDNVNDEDDIMHNNKLLAEESPERLCQLAKETYGRPSRTLLRCAIQRDGHPQAMYDMARQLLGHHGGGLVSREERDQYLPADDYLHQAARRGHVESLFQLGELYTGRSSKTDRLQGLKYYKRASDAGHLRATEHLAGHSFWFLSHDENEELAWIYGKRAESLRLQRLTDEQVHSRVANWNELIGQEGSSGRQLEEALKTEAIALLDATWLINYASSGNILKPRQELQKEAFLPWKDLVRATADNKELRIVALSYMWLDRRHPDPEGKTLDLVAKTLRTRYGSATWGVFWDFGSLYQHPHAEKGIMRTKKEAKLFQQGRHAMVAVYSHPKTTVFAVREFPKHYSPPDGEIRPYRKRGWPFAESSWANVTKQVLTLRYEVRDWRAKNDTDNSGVELNTHRLLTPAQFESEMQKCSFTNEREDRRLVIKLYSNFFDDYFGSLVHWDTSERKWGDYHVATVTRIIKSGKAHKLESLSLRGMNADGCRRIAQALKKTCPELRALILDWSPNMGDAGMQELSPILHRLEKLVLSRCRIGGGGCRVLAKCIRLNHLDLSGNPIAGRGSVTVGRVLRKLKPREPHARPVLNLNGCPKEGVDIIRGLLWDDWDVSPHASESTKRSPQRFESSKLRFNEPRSMDSFYRWTPPWVKDASRRLGFESLQSLSDPRVASGWDTPRLVAKSLLAGQNVSHADVLVSILTLLKTVIPVVDLGDDDSYDFETAERMDRASRLGERQRAIFHRTLEKRRWKRSKPHFDKKRDRART